MKPGEFVINKIMHSLWICIAPDLLTFVADRSYLARLSYKPVGLRNFQTNDYIFNPSQSLIDFILAGRPLPSWCHSFMSNIVPASTLPSGPQLYPIGTMFLGSSRGGNIWIINKQNSREISLLWEGRNKRFCGSELERQDKLATDPQTLIMSEVDQEISSQVGGNLKGTKWPKWAIDLILAPKNNTAILTPPPVINNPHLSAWTEVYVPKVETKVDKIENTCEHEFKLYTGLTKVYNYCTKCDHKENVPK